MIILQVFRGRRRRRRLRKRKKGRKRKGKEMIDKGGEGKRLRGRGVLEEATQKPPAAAIEPPAGPPFIGKHSTRLKRNARRR